MWLRIPSESFHSSPGPAASTSELESLAGRLEASAMWRSTLRPLASWLRVLKTEAWMTRRFGAMFDPSTASLGAAEWISSLGDSLVPIFPWQGEGTESPKEPEADFGSNTLESFAKFNPDGSLSRTFRQFSLFQQDPSFLEGLPKAGSMRNGFLFERPTLELRTSESESSFWPTATSQDEHTRISKHSQDGEPLTAAIHRWNTPHGLSTYGGGEFAKEAKNWPTPLSNPEAPNNSTRRESGRVARRDTDQCLASRAQAVANWPTPRAEDSEACGNHPGATDSLTGMMKLWPTAMSSDGTRGNRADHMSRNPKAGGDLTTAANSWPSPTAHDGRRPGSDATSTQGGNLKRLAEEWQTPATDSFRSRGGDRKDEMGLDQQARMFPTPKARDHKSAAGESGALRKSPDLNVVATTDTAFRPVQTSSSDGPESSKQSRGSGPRLNPAFVCTLMGWPSWWTHPEPINYARAEMESFLFAQRRRLSSLLGVPE